MKTCRLISILTILLRQGTATAPELAKRLEVSSRTVRRDVEELCMAGIPILTRQGAGGGISIAEGYRLDGRLLSSRELNSVLAGLQGLNSVNAVGVNSLIEKLKSGQDGRDIPDGSILIDLASYYRESLSIKTDQLQKAITSRQIVSFEYFYEKGRQRRRVEPYFLFYRWASWYLFAYCLKRSDFRTFKLNRLWDIDVEQTFYAPRTVPTERVYGVDCWPAGTETVIAIFDASTEYLLVENYGPESYRRLPDGRLYFEWEQTQVEAMVHWILSFGSLAEVIAPEAARKAVAEEARKMCLIYENSPRAF